MRILYFDCFSGISGDMSLAALLDLGIDEQEFRRELEKLHLEGYELRISRKVKNGITGTDVDVRLLETDEHHHHDGHGHHHEHKHDHKLEHEHEHVHEHEHEHKHEHVHEQEGHHHQEHHHQEHQHSQTARNLRDIEELIDASLLTQKVKDFSKKVFREIARAEAKVHNKEIHEVHFHEVGAVDSIVDIVGVSIRLDLLGIDRVFSSVLHDGCGFIKCQHGTIPVPVPAVMEMLAGSKVRLIQENIPTELVTPTGMGLIKSLTEDFGSMPAMLVDRIGYGMGKRETGGFNALRVVVGTSFEENGNDEIAVLETNIDDMSPELLGYTMESLLENGALDVFHTSVYMKKNRPAVMLTVLTRMADEQKLADILIKETSTLGIRRSTSKRYCMDREIIKVDTGYGEARVKIATREGVRKFSPEYEDCREIAKRTGLAIRDVYQRVYDRMKGL
jgi:pyridinium-3,5-bisthiocarboxylic acid mononucleotide nickel chelatase